MQVKYKQIQQLYTLLFFLDCCPELNTCMKLAVSMTIALNVNVDVAAASACPDGSHTSPHPSLCVHGSTTGGVETR